MPLFLPKLPGNQMFLDADSQNIIDGIRSTLLPKGDGMIMTTKGLQQILDSGKALPFADGVLINGQGWASFSGDQGVQYKRDKVVLVMVKSMKNPRSALIKTSIMVSSDIFKAFGVKLFDSTSDSINQLLLQLLLKACQDKKFVCEEAERALLAMVEAMAPLPLLQKLSAYVGHSNLKVRAKAAIFISKCELDRKVKCVFIYRKEVGRKGYFMNYPL
ncbi:hypothetical protein CASFOL_023406 [Castilleja foliolosa]|uniref:Uncharacterized protein n=1 Tax=Castilleja foliolosa TaxID=1961234 RepID=A0ABD3CPB8_9LAMI